MDSRVMEGIRLFNQQRFFEAHEVLEDVWRLEKGETKDLLHGLIQIAAAFHHLGRLNPAGFTSLLEKGSARITRRGDESLGLDWAAFEREIAVWREYAAKPDAISRPRSLPRLTLGAR